MEHAQRRLDRLHDGERVLTIPTPEETLGRPGLAVLQEKSVRPWLKPRMMVDLSRDSIKTDLLSIVEIPEHGTYAASYRDQNLFGFHHLHAMVGRDGVFNCQEIENYLGRVEIHLGDPPPKHCSIPEIRRRGTGYIVNFDRLNEPAMARLPGFTFFGSPIEPANWGMWLLNGLLSASSYVAAGQPGRYLCYAPADWQKRLLAFMGIQPEKLVQQAPWTTYACEEVAWHQYSLVDLIPDTLSKALFRNIVARCAAADCPPAERIFVSRRSFTQSVGGRYRALINETELQEALAAKGFVSIEPELLSFEQQVKLFSRAKIVVGLAGAGMFNTVFCSPGTKVISIESTAAFTHNHARLFAALGLPYGFIFGQQESGELNYPHNRWTIDVAAAVSAVGSL